ARRVLMVPGQLAPEKPLLESDPHDQEREWNDREQRRRVRSQPHAETDIHQRIAGVHGVASEAVDAAVDHRVLSFMLETHDRRRDRVRAKRYGNEYPTEGEQQQADTRDRDGWNRQYVPAKDVERIDDGHGDERGPHEGEQDQLVDPGLIAVDEHGRPFGEEGGIDAEDRDRAQRPHDDEDGEKNPGALPGERAGRDEQCGRDDECVGDDPCEYSKHAWRWTRTG